MTITSEKSDHSHAFREGNRETDMKSFFQLAGLFWVIVAAADCRAGDVVRVDSIIEGMLATENTGAMDKDRCDDGSSRDG